MSYRNSLRRKIVALVLSTTLSALVLANATFLYFDSIGFRETISTDMRTQISLLSSASIPALQFEDRQVAQENLDLLRLRPGVRAAAIYDARGALFATYVRAGITHDFARLPGAYSTEIADGMLSVVERIQANDEILGSAFLLTDFPLRERLLNYLKYLAFITLAAMALAAAVAFWLQGLITQPVLSIVAIAREVVATKNYTRRAVKQSHDEVGELVDSFNNMLDVVEGSTQRLETTNRALELQIGEANKARQLHAELNRVLEHKVAERTAQLEASNKELESFCYSVSHDLRGPLRAISGFSQALSEELAPDSGSQAAHYLDRIVAGTYRMGQLIEDLLNLSRVSRGELVRKTVDLSEMARSIIEELQKNHPKPKASINIWDNMHVEADPKLLHIALSNLLHNAWKFSSKLERPMLMLGVIKDGPNQIHFIRDNGAGFDMSYADKLFQPFQRLHSANEFPGTGIGLATVQRIIVRHGGRIWADAEPGNGTVFYFTLDNQHLLDPHTLTLSSTAGAQQQAVPPISKDSTP